VSSLAAFIVPEQQPTPSAWFIAICQSACCEGGERGFDWRAPGAVVYALLSYDMAVLYLDFTSHIAYRTFGQELRPGLRFGFLFL
jgi:hypothetical protein